MDFGSVCRRHGTRLVAMLLVGVTYLIARTPQLGGDERQELAKTFSFTPHPLPGISAPKNQERPLSAKWRHISAYLSAFGGAAVAITDLDGSGLAQDVCLVDPRTDEVLVMPAPTTPQRYAAFALPAQVPADVDPQSVVPMGCLPADFNEDGSMDLMVYYFGRPPVVFLRQPNIPVSAAAFVAQDVAPPTERWNTMTALLADVDGDGHIDVVIGNYYPDHTAVFGEQAAGHEHLFESFSNDYSGGTKHILLWAGASAGAHPSVQFRDIANGLPDAVERSWTLAMAAVDLDGDLLPELYIANDQGPDHLLHNESKPGAPAFKVAEGIRHFTTPRSKVLGQDAFHGMGAEFADLGGHGLLDLFVSNLTVDLGLHESHFAFINTGHPELLSRGVAPFEDESEPLGLSRSGWAWDARLADFNNSGQLQVMQALGFIRGKTNRMPEMHETTLANDALIASPQNWHRFELDTELAGQGPNAFFVKGPSGRYFDVGAELGFDEPGVSRGLAVGDTAGDGRLDVVVANQWAASTLYKNNSPNPGAYLSLHAKLPLRTANAGKLVVASGHPDRKVLSHDAIGAVFQVTLPSGRQLVSYANGGNGHSGKSSPDLHFGLGNLPSDTPLKVAAAWRDTTGAVHHDTFTTTPGWHTVWLGAPLELAAMVNGGRP